MGTHTQTCVVMSVFVYCFGLVVKKELIDFACAVDDDDGRETTGAAFGFFLFFDGNCSSISALRFAVR